MSSKGLSNYASRETEAHRAKVRCWAQVLHQVCAPTGPIMDEESGTALKPFDC